MYEHDAAYLGAMSSQGLAVLYMVLAIGAHLDFDQPVRSPESQQFYQLGKAALSLDSVLEEQSITAIQALVSVRSVFYRKNG